MRNRKKYMKILNDRNLYNEDSDSWMMSYGDMMTLLFAFFVLLLSFSDINPVKMQLITNSVNKAIGGSVVDSNVTLAQVYDDLQKLIMDSHLESQVSVNRSKHGVELNLRGTSFFASGSAHLLEDAEKFLLDIARQINAVPYHIAIEGHTDNDPIRSDVFPSNWELSSARASTVVRFFIENGLPSSRFRAVGYADTKPVDMTLGNNTPEARAQNRRVAIVFLDIKE